MNPFIEDIRSRLRNGPLRTIMFVEAGDPRVLEAAQRIVAQKIITPLFVCEQGKGSAVTAAGLKAIEIEEDQAQALERLLLDIRSSKAGTPDEQTPEYARVLANDPLFYGAYLLRCGEADGLVAGAARTTADVLRAGLWLVGKAQGIQTVSSSFYMIVPPFRGGQSQEVLTFADCAVVPEPTAEQLADIAIAAADARSTIVGDQPRVALLSYSTKGSGGDGASILTIRKALELVRTRRPEIVIDGELQADAALIQSISDRKAPGNILAGRANVLVFPSLDAANIGYKLVTHLVPGVLALGPILQGLAKPMSDLSRGAQVEDIVNIAAIVSAQCHRSQ